MDITSAILDPEMGCTAFTVERITYTRTRSGTGVHSRTAHARGCIHPGTPETIKLLPEEERNEIFIAIYTDYALSTGMPEAPGASSFSGAGRIHWAGKTWRVVCVRDRNMFGYYQAYAVLMHEESQS